MNNELILKNIAALDLEYHGDIEHFLHDLKIEISNHLKASQSVSKHSKPNTGKEIISISGLNKYYSKGSEQLHVLKDLNLTVYEGEIVALIGPSGSGKSTLLNLIGGLDTASEGKVEVDGQNLSLLNDKELSVFRNKTIGFVFQFFNLQPYLNVQENIEIPLLFKGENEETRNKSSIKAVDSVKLADRIKHLPGELSGGQMQRVAIARAIVNNPKLILADEPTGNLDRNTGKEIISLLKEINKTLNTTIIIVTHDNFVASQANRVIRMEDGKLITN